MDVAINLKAALVVGRHHEASFGVFEILRCHRIEALFRIGNFMNALLLRQAFHGVGRLAPGEGLDSPFKFGISLPDDFFKVGSPHAGVLHLLEGPAGIHGLMLFGIAHQQNPVLRS